MSTSSRAQSTSKAAGLILFSRISMRRAIQPRAVSLDCVEEQHDVRAILVWMSYHCDRIAGLVCLRSPPHGGHEANGRGLDNPGSHRGRIRRARRNRDDDVAM